MEDNLIEIPGTAQIRKIGSYMSSMELLSLSARLAKEGFYKKLWSVLSRVFEDKKSFEYKFEEGMKEYVDIIIESEAPAELKIQTFTSFRLPKELLPDMKIIKEWIDTADKKRSNISAYFISFYDLTDLLYDEIKANTLLFSALIKVLSEDKLIDLFIRIFTTETKEVITGDIRTVGKCRKRFKYTNIDKIQKLTDIAFEEKGVFFTSKLLYCMTFCVPSECVVNQKDLFKNLKISINYEERITKDFINMYNIDFDISDLAICKYYLANKKSQNQRNIVHKFAVHLVRVNDMRDRAYLLRTAFKRGGAFRMYAGCMQDGRVDMDKMRRFRYTAEEVEWVKTLPGLNK